MTQPIGVRLPSWIVLGESHMECSATGGFCYAVHQLPPDLVLSSAVTHLERDHPGWQTALEATGPADAPVGVRARVAAAVHATLLHLHPDVDPKPTGDSPAVKADALLLTDAALTALPATPEESGLVVELRDTLHMPDATTREIAACVELMNLRLDDLSDEVAYLRDEADDLP